jgi:hypothetical protein
MAIHDNNVVESNSGFAKEIDAAGLAMVLDNLQVNQYQYPLESTVREVASNAVDAVKEKQIAIEILSGRAKAEDYYLQREEAIFQSSNFDASYFDLAWLNQTDHSVTIIYEEGDQINTRDLVRFVDTGVGLGGKRLEGYFKLSWSSKRNSKDALGKFGIGAKSPLSTGVDSYRMISRYNGQEFMFDIYAHKVDSAISKFNEDGTINDFYQFENGFKAYYRKTNQKNGTEILLETKKHHRQKYKDAAKSQLLYFKNIKFLVKESDGYTYDVPVRAGIIYEDADIILSDNNQFSKPHLVIGKEDNKVNYGYIDFLELELENKVGNIGIKVASEDVAINPSRESVIWNDKTRLAVTQKFEKVVDIATDLIQKELKETDFLSWLDKCSIVLGGYSYSQDTAISRLSRVVDKSVLSPKFNPDPSIKYGPMNKMFRGFTARVISIKREYSSKLGKYVEKPQRLDVTSWAEIQGLDIFFSDSAASYNKDIYLSKTKARFVVIKEDSEEEVKEYVNKLALATITADDILAHRKKLRDMMMLNTGRVSVYEDVVVPEAWAELKEDEEETNVPVLSPAEKRALEERVVVYSLHKNSYTSYNAPHNLSMLKHQPKLQEVKDWEGTVVYGHQEDEPMLYFLGNLLHATGAYDNMSFYNKDFRLVKINKGLKKHFKQHIHVKEFFVNLQDTTLTMNEIMVKWHTARLIHEELEKLPFLSNFATFNADIHTTFKELMSYRDINYVDLTSYRNANKVGCNPTAFKELCEGTQTIIDFQLFVEEHKENPEAITEKALSLFSNAIISDARAVELDVYKKLMSVVEYAEPIKALFNNINVLQEEGKTISYEIEQEIKAYMALKGL